MKKKRSHSEDLRSAARLAITAVSGATDVVEEMNRTIASGPASLGKPLSGPATLITGIAYGAVRGVARLLGNGVDLLLAQASPLLGSSTPGPEREAVLAVLNGVLGDHLAETKNPLAIEMRFRQRGHALELNREALARDLPDATNRLLLLIHGSSMNDVQWTRLGHNHGEQLAIDLGYTPISLHYNSGLHISVNGRALAEMLEELVQAFPAELQEIVIIGHSMGGLVARSACHFGAGKLWRARLTRLLTLGTPHHGAQLERVGNFLQALIAISRYSAPVARLAKVRSAGVTDLRFGNVRDEDWQGRERFARGPDGRTPLPLPEGVDCFAIAGTNARKGEGKLTSDGLVSVDSALGQHADPRFRLRFPAEHKWIGHELGHLELLSSEDVYRQIRSWLAHRI